MPYQSLRTASAALILALAATACGGSEEAETPTNTSSTTSETTEPATPSAPTVVAEPGMAFDGNSFAGTPLETPIESFAVVTRLRANTATADPAEFTETTPPMPFVVGGVWASQIGDRVSINSNIVNDITGDFREITIVNIAGEGLRVYADGELVGEGEAVDAAKSVLLGRGYQDRFWTGRADGFDVIDLTGAESFPEPAELSGFPVVFELGEDMIRERN